MPRPKKNPDAETKSTTKKTVETTEEKKPRAITEKGYLWRISKLEEKRAEIDAKIEEYKKEIEKINASKSEEQKKRDLTKKLMENMSFEELQALLEKSKNTEE